MHERRTARCMRWWRASEDWWSTVGPGGDMRMRPSAQAVPVLAHMQAGIARAGGSAQHARVGRPSVCGHLGQHPSAVYHGLWGIGGPWHCMDRNCGPRTVQGYFCMIGGPRSQPIMIR